MNMTLNRNDNHDNHETKKDTKKDNNENENDDTGKDVSPSSPSSPEKFLAECVTPRLNSAIKKTKQVLHRTETVVETHVLCSPMRWMIHFPREWPRVSTFLFAVVLPLWILIAVAMGFGVLLAQYESPTEIEGNDAILAARAQIAFFDVSAANLLNITNVCWTEWEQTFFGRNDTTQDFQFNNINDTIMENEEGYAWINRSLLEDSLNRCTSSYLPQMQKLQEVTQNNSEAFESLRFNWNRCWDTEIFGNSNLVVHPTEAQKIAATPAAQEEYFNEVWTSMQVDLYQQYLPPNPTSEEEEEAFLRSVQEATGVSACTENTGGTAWFFFTIMTTIGKFEEPPSKNDISQINVWMPSSLIRC